MLSLKRMLAVVAVLLAVGAIAAVLQARARDAARAQRRETCQRQLKAIGAATRQYAEQHKGFYPDTWGTLAREMDLTSPQDLNDLFICNAAGKALEKAGKSATPIWGPQDVDAFSSYSLVPGLMLFDDAATVLAYERNDNHAGDGRSVLYADGRVVWISTWGQEGSRPPRTSPGAPEMFMSAAFPWDNFKQPEESKMNSDWRKLATIESGRDFGFRNGGWAYDAYPELETLDAGKAITVAEFEGPAVVTRMHLTQHMLPQALDGRPEEEASQFRGLSARGIILEIYYNGEEEPSVRVPYADFFGDGACAQGAPFSTGYVEKSPGGYNCTIPMPFEKSIRIVLRNTTEINLPNYTYVEFERLPKWDPSLGYFHATWKRFAFQLRSGTIQPFFHVEGQGHLLGRSCTITTDEPMFGGFGFVMEGNNEVRLDGEEAPRGDYLGTECSWGVCWGWMERFIGVYNGITYVQHKEPAQVAVYRFRNNDLIRFDKSLDWRINWSHEFRGHTEFHNKLAERVAADGGWVDYAITHYWYQRTPGFDHGPLMPLEDRIKKVLRPNPK